MGDHHSPTAARYADRETPVLILRMVGVEDGYAEWVSQNGSGFDETDAVLAKVRFRFLRVPFKLDH